MKTKVYKTILYKDANTVTGIDVAQNNADRLDFVDNYLSSTILISEVCICADSFVVYTSYQNFKTLFSSWGLVKYEDKTDKYILYLEVQTTAESQSTITVNAQDMSILLKAANKERREIWIRNTSSKVLYICPFTPATTDTPIVLNKEEILISETYNGAYYGIWDSGATGKAIITEFTV